MQKNVRALKLDFSNDLSKEQREKRKEEFRILLRYKEYLQQQGENPIIKGLKIIVDNSTLILEYAKEQLNLKELEHYQQDSDGDSDSGQ